jgi:hypothetical protein
LNSAPARTRATSCGALTARQRAWADSMSLNAKATPAAREPGPLVTRVRNRTVAKVDSICGAQMHPMLGRVAVERKQHVEVVADFRDRFGPFRTVVIGERFGGFDCLGFVFGFVDLAPLLFSRPGAPNPVEAITHRTSKSADCQQRVRKALTSVPRH